MSPWVRALAALLKHTDSIPSTTQELTTVNSSSRRVHARCLSMGIYSIHVVHRSTYRQNHIHKINRSLKKAKELFEDGLVSQSSGCRSPEELGVNLGAHFSKAGSSGL